MLEARNISYARGAIPIISNISFTLNEGEMLAIRGANGSGKSTLLRIVAGLIWPEPGTLYWKGKRFTIETQQEILYIGHKLALYQDALLKDQIRLWNVLCENALEKWGVAGFKNKKISQLSQGQQKRISLSRCSWEMKSLWILDEPHVGLDEEGKSILHECITGHLEGGGSVLMASHEVNFKGNYEPIPGTSLRGGTKSRRGNPFFLNKDGLPRPFGPRNDEYLYKELFL